MYWVNMDEPIQSMTELGFNYPLFFVMYMFLMVLFILSREMVSLTYLLLLMPLQRKDKKLIITTNMALLMTSAHACM